MNSAYVKKAGEVSVSNKFRTRNISISTINTDICYWNEVSVFEVQISAFQQEKSAI